jgi:hypothetical protein
MTFEAKYSIPSTPHCIGMDSTSEMTEMIPTYVARILRFSKDRLSVHHYSISPSAIANPPFEFFEMVAGNKEKTRKKDDSMIILAGYERGL